jgi:Flp pilus assembly protein TadG
MRFLGFAHDERGSISTVFAFTSIVLLMSVGVAVDYTRMSTAKTRLQNAADSTLLAVAQTAKANSNIETLTVIATDQLETMLPDGYDFEITSLNKQGSTLSMTAAGSVPAGITSVAGYEELGFSAESQVYWGTGKIELIMVLDNTGSMANYGRMTEMKKAANALLDALESSEQGLVKVGIVPFDTNVRIPTSYKTASWFKASWLVSLFWQGCITDRDQPYDVSDAAVTSASATKYPGAMCTSNGLQTIQPLTNDFTALRNKVSGMSPAGNTNITIGLSWGVTLLSQQAPFAEGVPWGTKDLTKVIVLMTDGDNTENRWTSWTSSIDDRTELACQSAKDSGAILYTVRLIEGNADLLRDCATSADTYYDVENVDDLVPAFEAIGEQISQLRITQ